MSEFLLELYSEEIPPLLQVSAKKNLSLNISKMLEDEGINGKKILSFSTPTRLVIYIKDLPKILTISEKEIKGPKVGVNDQVLSSFLNSQNATKEDLYKKELEKGQFYFIKQKSKKTSVDRILIEVIKKALNSINWKKSMKWSDHSLMWGRPLRSIFAIFDKKLLSFKFHHITTTNNIKIEQDLLQKKKIIKSFKEYKVFLNSNSIIFDQEARKEKVLSRFKNICSSNNCLENFDAKLLDEVVNIVESPNVILIDFDKSYLSLPSEIIISTLKKNQRYFPLFDKRNRLTNQFLVVINKQDSHNLIKIGNKRVVEARLSDAKFFWDKDKSKNLIKQIGKLKSITFYDKIGTIYDKTQRLRRLASFISDEFNINKEKVEIAASISKSDLCSDLVSEFPELQGVMGKYFALTQGFDVDISNAISEHYLPLGLNSDVPKKPISYTISLADKLDSLVSFFFINEKPTSSKDPFALRRSAIGLLRIIIENKLNIKLRDLIDQNIRVLEEQNVKRLNQKAEKEVFDFFKERMRNILKEKSIKPDIIEASISSHHGDNFLDLYKKNFFMNKYINKEVGQNTINSYKRAFNIIEKEGLKIEGRPDAVLFRKEEEKGLFDKINEIRKAFTVKEDNKNYENLLFHLSEIKPFTDNFFDNVVVNDENKDIKNNRLELLKMYCNTFNNFIDFSKLEGA